MTLPIVLILIGLLLIIVEIIIVPGFGLPGIVGGIFLITGLYLSFKYNVNFGVTITFMTSVISIGMGYWAFKGNALNKMTLHNALKGKVNNERLADITIGQEGVTTSRLSPTGDARFDEKNVEVQSISGFIDVNCTIVIEKIENNTIFVTPKITL